MSSGTAAVVICHSTMTSNSIRISAELFDRAQRQGDVPSRSAAQQVEHWARLGAALEGSGLSVLELVAVLQGAPQSEAAHAAQAHAVPEADLWAFKRAQQQRDVANISGGRARRAKAIDSPF
jgi:hypothetical protein